MKNFDFEKHNQLLKYTLQDVVKKTLSELKYDDDLTVKDKLERFNFLFNAGFFKDLFEALLIQIKKNKEKDFFIYFFKCAYKLDLPISKNHWQIFFSIADLDKLTFFSFDSKLIQMHDNLKSCQNQTLQKLRHKEYEYKKHLIEKIEFMQNQRILDGERKALAEFLKAYPEDKTFQNNKIEFEEKWARNIIDKYQQRNRNKLSETLLDKTRIPKFLFHEMNAISKISSEDCYNMVMFCLFLEVYDDASKLCENFKTISPKSLWIHFESSFFAKKYFLALDLLLIIEIELCNDPETAMAVIYNKALVLHGLKYRSSAIELLEQIINVNPSYRSTSSLLRLWKGANVG
jgi:tetratricopeptide (TPR) repeat protein